jgi:hypothetical protein
MSTALVVTSISLDNGMADIGLRRSGIQASLMMRLYFVVDSEEEAGEIVDDYFFIEQWCSDKIRHLGNVSLFVQRP